MRHLTRAALLAAAAALLGPAAARGDGHPGGGTGFRETERQLKLLFQRSHPCPANGKTVGNCPGYQVGYLLHPRNGGQVSQDNMRWMTDAEYEQTRQEWTPGS